MKTEQFAKLLQRICDRGPQTEGALVEIPRLIQDVEARPSEYRKALQRVETEPDLTFEEMRDALVSIKLFLVAPMLAGHLDTVAQNRARIAMTKLWNALLPDYAEKAS